VIIFYRNVSVIYVLLPKTALHNILKSAVAHRQLKIAGQLEVRISLCKGWLTIILLNHALRTFRDMETHRAVLAVNLLKVYSIDFPWIRGMCIY